MTSNVFACKTHHKSVIQKFTFGSAGERPKRKKQKVWRTRDDKTISWWTKENGHFVKAEMIAFERPPTKQGEKHKDNKKKEAKSGLFLVC